jgi:transcriptional regulator with XRE-family HTH domain
VIVREIRIKAALLKAARADADVEEAELRESIVGYLTHGEAAIFADTVGVSPQYLSDIRNGRRRISDDVVEKLVKIR